jgi:adenosylcobinamide-GDP ribazoletransferase
LIKRFIAAFGFLTIIPVARAAEITEDELARSSPVFPLVGLVQGAVLYVFAYVLWDLFPPGVLSGLVILVHVLINGAFHLDGLSDTFDALAVRGRREQKLDAMKDGRSGAVGVTSIVLSVLLKFLLLQNIMMSHQGLFCYAVLMMPVVSRWVMVVSMYHGRPARTGGLGQLFIKGTGARKFTAATLIVCALITFCAIFVLSLPHKHLLNALVLIVVYLFSLWMLRLFNREFGGLTGDTLGASGEMAEILFLLMVVLWSGFYF